MESVSNRRSIRKFDQNYKIPKEEMIEILEKSSRAPSSSNLQPWRFVVVESKEGKEMLRPAMIGNISQLETSSAMIVLFSDMDKYQTTEKIMNEAVKQNIMPEEVAIRQIKQITSSAKSVSYDKVLSDNNLDIGLVAMMLMSVAKEHGYQTSPMGGFNSQIINNCLGIEKRYHPVMIIAIGKGVEDGFPSYRLPSSETTKFL